MNDSMGAYVSQETVKMMIDNGARVKGANALVLGITFKENCPDIRNSRVIDIIEELHTYNINVDVYDPWIDPAECAESIESPKPGSYDAIVLAVSHQEFAEMGIEQIRELGKESCVIFDVKHLFAKELVDGSL